MEFYRNRACCNRIARPMVAQAVAETASMPLAMAYVPFQKWGEIYELDAGFSRGTIFPELDLPWLGGCAL